MERKTRCQLETVRQLWFVLNDSPYQHQFRKNFYKLPEDASRLFPCSWVSPLLLTLLQNCHRRYKITCEIRANVSKTLSHYAMCFTSRLVSVFPNAYSLVIQNNIGSPNVITRHVKHFYSAIFFGIPFEFIVIPRLLHPQIRRHNLIF